MSLDLHVQSLSHRVWRINEEHENTSTRGVETPTVVSDRFRKLHREFHFRNAREHYVCTEFPAHAVRVCIYVYTRHSKKQTDEADTLYEILMNVKRDFLLMKHN